jgi:hypothetical protein
MNEEQTAQESQVVCPILLHQCTTAKDAAVAGQFRCRVGVPMTANTEHHAVHVRPRAVVAQ